MKCKVCGGKGFVVVGGTRSPGFFILKGGISAPFTMPCAECKIKTMKKRRKR